MSRFNAEKLALFNASTIFAICAVKKEAVSRSIYCTFSFNIMRGFLTPREVYYFVYDKR
jgi:hypothetical protein